MAITGLEILALVQLFSAILSLVRQGIVGFEEVQGVFNRFKGITDPTPAEVEQLRIDLLNLAKRVEPGKRPDVLAQLKKDGIDPADIGLL